MYYRECKDLNGNKAYEFQKLCNCYHCQMRNRIHPGTRNQVTVTTENPLKFKEIEEFLNGWSCGSKRKEKIFYFNF